MPLHAQKKGKRGEVEFCRWLKDNLGIEVERNYNQADGCSVDVITEHFLFEVKRREGLDLKSWWWQCAVATKAYEEKTNHSLIGVVPFRKNRQPWSFLIPAKLLNGVDRGFILVEENVFVPFAKRVIG